VSTKRVINTAVRS